MLVLMEDHGLNTTYEVLFTLENMIPFRVISKIDLKEFQMYG